MLRDILGENYDLADPDTTQKADKILWWRLVEFSNDDYELTIKDGTKPRNVIGESTEGRKWSDIQ